MKPELLSPAGDFDSALAAFNSGADAVYCSLSEFSARAFAKNLSRDELKNLVRMARAADKKVYVAFNTIVDEGDLERAIEQLSIIAHCRPHGVIVQDLGVARLCRKFFPSLELHASTQLVAHNLEGVTALAEMGFKRVVLARELSLQDIAAIAKRCGDIELECFVHGALCYSISGLCLFSAMEKNRSGNRGKCAYCCRLAYETGDDSKTLAFSMKDLHVGEGAKALVAAGVKSLKIEGRMKSPLYVAAASAYYRAVLDGDSDAAIAAYENLQTVFSRRTTSLYFNGENDDVIDPVSLGHFGAYTGRIKRITKDRDGRRYLRFHTVRPLEKHDGLQIPGPQGGKPAGFGITEMRTSISRSNVFEVPADCDVEVLLPDDAEESGLLSSIRPGGEIYCSMSNAVKRTYPVPGFRPEDYPGFEKVDVEITVSSNCVRAIASNGAIEVDVSVDGMFSIAKDASRTSSAIENAFSKLGGTDYTLGELNVINPDLLFVPISMLNNLRRRVVDGLDSAREEERRVIVEKALEDFEDVASLHSRPSSVLKMRAGQKLPGGDWDEIVLAITSDTKVEYVREAFQNVMPKLRLALPVFTLEREYQKLRVAIKRFVREGFMRWEASDIATLKTLRMLGVTDISADWTLYAFNSASLAALSELGVSRFVASAENSQENLNYLSESGYAVEFLSQQSTPLFISLTPPAAPLDPNGAYVSFNRDGLWVTTTRLPRVFNPPRGTPTRIDLSWSSQ